MLILRISIIIPIFKAANKHNHYLNMKTTNHFIFRFTLFVCICFPLITACNKEPATTFIHPGIDQTQPDLDFMKAKVLAGEQPWKDAFEKLKEKTDLSYEIITKPHIIQGAYGKPDIGGKLMSSGADMAYNCALIWYITGDKAYAQKAIDIMNAWSSGIWDFDDNNAKLLVALSGQVYCNAAEIIRYSDAGWKQKDIEAFENMLTSVFYPVIRTYFPEANGNWNGAIIRTIMAIAVFTDNRAMFDDAVAIYLYAPYNGSILKYVYPSGQCQESIRDQNHVQMGLREFAGAARIAFSQGTDLWSVADNRLALGFEYTAQYMVNGIPFCYGNISELHKVLHDEYEFAYRHYTASGLDMPYTKIAADSIRPESSRNALTAWRAPNTVAKIYSGTPQLSQTAYPAGALPDTYSEAPEGSRIVNAGEPVQEALNETAGTGKWVILKKGIHNLTESLVIPSGITLAGEGRETIIHNDGGKVNRMLINEDENLHDVTIRDLLIEGSRNVVQIAIDPNTDRIQRLYKNVPRSTGIIFLAKEDGQMKNINLINITVQNTSLNGIYISGAQDIQIKSCDFTDNGSGLVPGPRHHHNLLLSHVLNTNIEDCRIVASPSGCGISLDKCRDIIISGCEIARNDWYGIKMIGSENIGIEKCLIETNSNGGILAEYLGVTNKNIQVINNTIQYNNGYGIESYASQSFNEHGNRLTANGGIDKEQYRITGENIILINHPKNQTAGLPK